MTTEAMPMATPTLAEEGLSAKCVAILERHGIDTADKLAARSVRELLRLRHCGVETTAEITLFMARIGRPFPDFEVAKRRTAFARAVEKVREQERAEQEGDTRPSRELLVGGLPRRVVSVLARRYITTIHELAKYSVYELLAMKISAKNVAEICAFMHRIGRTLEDMERAAAEVPEFGHAMADVLAMPAVETPGPKPFRLFSNDDLDHLRDIFVAASNQPQSAVFIERLERLQTGLFDEIESRPSMSQVVE